MNIKKLSLNDLLNLDLAKLNKFEVREVSDKLNKIARQRINRLKKDKTGRLSPSLSKFKNKPFSTSENVKNERNINLRNIRRARTFLSNPTSTVSGAKAFRKKLDKTIKETSKKVTPQVQQTTKRSRGRPKRQLGDPLTDRQFKRYWRLWDKLKDRLGGEEAISNLYGSKGSSKLMTKLEEQVTSGKYITNDDILDSLEDLADDLYESEVEYDEDLALEDDVTFTIDDEDDDDEFDFDDDDLPF